MTTQCKPALADGLNSQNAVHCVAALRAKRGRKGITLRQLIANTHKLIGVS